MATTAAPPAHDNFVLRWNDFAANAAGSFPALRQDRDFTDVALAAEDDEDVDGDCGEVNGPLLRAHRVVLAAASPLLRGILRRCGPGAQNGNGHPVLLMPSGVRRQELSALLDFIYRGEVTVPNDRLNALLAAANLLKVKGLVDETAAAAPAQEASPPAVAETQQQHQQQQQQHEYQQHRQRTPKPPPPSAASNVPRRRTLSSEDFDPSPAAAPKQQKKPSGFQMRYESPADSGKAFYGDAKKQPSDQDETNPIGQSPMHLPPETAQPKHPDQDLSQQQHQQQQQQQQQPPTRFIGLQCPRCPEQLPGPEAFRRHMEEFHPMQQQQQQQEGFEQAVSHSKKKRPGRPPQAKPKDDDGGEDTTAYCPICDKAFKNKSYVRAHQKRMHRFDEDGVELPRAAPGKRGRPPKKKLEGDEQQQMQYGEDHDEGDAGQMYDSSVERPKKAAKRPPRPVGQVQPAPRTQRPQQQQQQQQQQEGEFRRQQQTAPKSRGSHHQVDPLGHVEGGEFDAHGEPRPGTSGMQQLRRQRPFTQQSRKNPGGGGHRQQQQSDLKRSLGLKFGGQISITSSEHSDDGVPSSSKRPPTHRSPVAKQYRRPPAPPQPPVAPQLPVEIKQEPAEDPDLTGGYEEDYGEDYEGMDYETGEVMYGEEEGEEYLGEEEETLEGEEGEFEEEGGH